MRNFFWVALLLSGFSGRAARAQNPPALSSAAEASPRFAAQKKVVYPIRDASRISAAIDWYAGFFGQPPAQVELAAPYPYAVFEVDGVEVRLETDPRFLQLKEAVFYWVLPTPTDVARKYAALDADPANRFERGLFQRIHQLEDRRTATAPAAAAVTEVKEFIVLDPAGNQVGVINNPIYVPPTTLPGGE